MTNRRRNIAAMAAVILAVPVLALAQATTTIRGNIVSSEGDHIVVRTDAGERAIVVGPSTKVEAVPAGLGLRREDRTRSALIRGLLVEVIAVPSGDQFVANSINFRTADERAARTVEAGIVGTEARLSEAERRLDDVGNLVAAGRTKVFFDVGKTALKDEGKKDLCSIANEAKGKKGGYRLAVVGRADPTGNAAANQRLSEKRAQAVSDYLMRSCGVRPGNVLPSTALGDSSVADDPDPPKNNAEGRRVTVTILVSKSSV